MVPAGIIPTFGRFSKSAMPLTTSLIVPSPPAATSKSKPAKAARLASFRAECGSGVVAYVLVS